MGSELAIRRTEVPAAFAEQMHMAKVLSESTLLPAHLRGKPANVLIILQGARALDVSAFWALQSMHVVDGKLSMAAELMRALVIRAGHQIRIVERSMNRAVIEIKRSDRPTPYLAEFTWQDAKDAGLEGKTNWKAYRKSMLVARATTIAVRDECPDVMFGVVYSAEELGAMTDADGNVVTDEAGNVAVDAEVVEILTPSQVQEIADSLVQCDFEDLPSIWAHVTEHASQFARVGDSDNTLTDYVGSRLGVEVAAARDKAEARVIWDLANVLKLGEVTILAGGEPIDLRAYIKATGNALPDAAEPEPAEVVVEAEVVDVSPGQPAVLDAEEVLPDTPHAREMAAAASASWGDQVAKIRGERKQALDELADKRAAQAEREREQQ